MSRWAQCNHKDPYKKEAEGSESESELEWWKEGLLVKEGGWPLGAGKGKEQIIPGAFRRNMALLTYFIPLISGTVR